MYTTLPLTFLLGFYVSLVVRRWWEQYSLLPWPDSLALCLRCVMTEGGREQTRILRRTVIRYCLLSYVLCIRRMSARLRRRFPTNQEIINTGLMRPDEAARVGSEASRKIYDSNWWLPIKWATEICYQAFQEGHITTATDVTGAGWRLLSDIAAFRNSLGEVENYGHIPVPLVYTQVVTIAVYFYFAVTLIGEQWLLRRQM